MAEQVAKGAGAAREPAVSSGMGRFRTMSIWAVTVAAVNEAGLRNVLASSMLTVAAPVTATAFVYEVSAMRTAELAHLAADHAAYVAGTDRAERTDDISLSTARKAAAGPDVIHKIDGMLDARAAMLDTFGDDPRTVAPVYARMIRQMLKDDEATFASLDEARDSRAGAIAAELSEKETQLRAIHAKLTKLAGA